MPAVASVRLDLKANTASASAGIDSLRKQLVALQKDSGGKLGSMLSSVRAQGFARMGSAVADAVSVLRSAILGPEEAANGEFGKAASVLGRAASEGGKMAAAFAPLGPIAAGVAGGVGALVGAVEELGEQSRKAKKEAEKAAEADRAARRGYLDTRVAHEIEWRNATDEQRARMQHEARGRMRDYRYRIDRGATISEKEIFDAANWDSSLTRDLLAEYRRQNGGKLSEALRPLGDTIRYEDRTQALYRAAEEANRMYGADLYEKLDAAERLLELHSRMAPGRGRDESVAKAERRKRELEEAISKWEAHVAPYEELLDEASYSVDEEALKFKWGESAHKGGFVAALDTLWEAMQAGKGDSGKPSGSPHGASFHAPAPSGVDSLSSAGIGFTGSDPMRREQVELLRSISETLRTIQGRGIPAVAV